MTSRIKNSYLKNRTWRLGSTAFLLISLIILTGATWYSTTKSETQPLSSNSSITQNLAANESSVGHSANQQPLPVLQPTIAFTPFLHIVPSQDGTELFISAGGVGQVGGTVVANIGIGPGHRKGGHTMTFSDTIQSYVTTTPGFDPHIGASGPINITTTLGSDTGSVNFDRPYIPPPPIPPTTVHVDDLTVKLVSTDTLATEAYIMAVRSYAPPSPPPFGHQLVGNAFRHAYSMRASGVLSVSNRPMILELDYGAPNLAGADPHTLAIFAWDVANKQWNNLGGTLFSNQQYLSVATSRFTTYALMATPIWRDEFDDFSGLDFSQINNVTLGGTLGNRTLILANSPGNGSAISKPVTPTTAIANWSSLTFTGIFTPPSTTLSVDILRLDNSPIMTNVASGASLAHLDPVQYPALKLRLNMNSTAVGQTPALEKWQLSWQVKVHEVYLPVVLKE